MRYLGKPGINDIKAIKELANNPNLKLKDKLVGVERAVTSAYKLYESEKGNALKIKKNNVSPDLKEALKYYYKYPPKSHKFITSIRKSLEGEICPMCGSFNPTTIEHVLPKGDYPKFYIYSLNLVPACVCNMRRGTSTKNAASKGRILHPYFDRILSKRLVVSSLSPPFENPLVELKNNLQTRNQKYCVVQFHIEELLKKTSIRNYLQKEWIKIRDQPDRVLYGFEDYATGVSSLQKVIKQQRTFADIETACLNNWKSIFLSGLLKVGVLQWLDQRYRNELHI